MGMYTLISVDFELKKETPKDVREILDTMINGSSEEQQALRAVFEQLRLTNRVASFFRTDRWVWLATKGSASFDEPTSSSFDGNRVQIQAHPKNYNDEIRKFLEWLEPYIDGSKLPIFDGRPFIGRATYENDTVPEYAIFWSPPGTVTFTQYDGLPPFTSHNNFWPGRLPITGDIEEKRKTLAGLRATSIIYDAKNCTSYREEIIDLLLGDRRRILDMTEEELDIEIAAAVAAVEEPAEEDDDN